MPDPVGPQHLDDLAELLHAVRPALLADMDRHAQTRGARRLDMARDLGVVPASAARTRPGDIDTDDPARRVPQRLLDDHHVLHGGERPVHHQDQPRPHLRVLERGPVEARGSPPG